MGSDRAISRGAISVVTTCATTPTVQQSTTGRLRRDRTTAQTASGRTIAHCGSVAVHSSATTPIPQAPTTDLGVASNTQMLI